MWKCSIHPDFAENTLLKEFLSNEVTISYDDALKIDEVVISRKDEKGCYIKKQVWKEILSYFETYTIDIWMRNYDYYFLQYALNDWENNNYDTLIVGSSYACFGYEERVAGLNAKNLALPSQDLYYASKIVEKCKEKNCAVKNILIGLGYYSFFSDLSRTENEEELTRISNVYYPIFQDAHNAIILPEQMGMKQSRVWDLQTIIKFFSNEIWRATKGTYFSVIHDRKKWKTVTWEDSFKEWDELLPQERESAGRKRAQFHNKSIAYSESYAENIWILNELANQCEKDQINLYICVFPVTTEYRKYIDKQIVENFWNALSRIKGKIHVLDLNESNGFDIADFNDMDHLSACGAIKATNLINNVIMG